MILFILLNLIINLDIDIKDYFPMISAYYSMQKLLLHISC